MGRTEFGGTMPEELPTQSKRIKQIEGEAAVRGQSDIKKLK